MTEETIVVTAAAFVAGASTVLLWQKWRRSKNDAGATVECDDLSLFYPDAHDKTADEASMRVIHPRCKFLEKDLYANVVRNTVVCCVDIVLVRRNAQTRRRECLLLKRAAEPAKGLWWWPGGRLLKGETFFDAAVRKAQQETGVHASLIRPVQVLGVWNTFFPYSSWDTDTIKGTQTVNPIVLVEFIDESSASEIKLDQQSENFKWITLNPAENQGEDKYVLAALNRLISWDPAYMYS